MPVEVALWRLGQDLQRVESAAKASLGQQREPSVLLLACPLALRQNGRLKEQRPWSSSGSTNCY